MQELPLTRASLLVRLRDEGDRAAWQEFVGLYGPVIYGFGRKRGLQDADAADLTQEVLRAVAGAADKLEYDPSRGTFRGWLYTIARNKLLNFLDGRRRRVQASGDSGTQRQLEEQTAREADLAQTWELEYERQLASRAMERIKDEFQPATWQAFWQTAVEGKGAREVGAGLGLTAGAVYVNKSRVLARLREEVQRLQDE